MLDIKQICNDKDKFIKGLNKRNKDFSIEINEMCALYETYLVEISNIEKAKALLNEKSKLIGVYKRENKSIDDLMQEINDVKKIIEQDNSKALFLAYTKILLTIPNVPDESCPVGLSEDDNVEVRKWGVPKEFTFEPRAHYEIGEIIDGLDFERAGKIAKSRFVITKGLVARLERAIANYMLDTHGKKGYIEFGVPVIVNQETLYATGQLPKFEDDLFKMTKEEDGRDFYLIPTAEVVLASYYKDEIIELNDQTLNYMAYTQNFRKEAGSAGKDTRGMIRVHQFGKVELFKYTTEEKCFLELDNLVKDAEEILEGLELPYRVVNLCTGDMGFGAIKTFDLEVWVPAQQKYRECSSCSCVGDFQARRGKIRYKDQGGKIKFPFMLNGSGMATGRILVAVMENYQNEDGTITIPKVLEKYMMM